MGAFEVRIGVSNGNGGPTRWVDAMVDTGAVYSVFPESLLREEVGVEPKRSMSFAIADGNQITLPVGEARIVAEGMDAFSPVVFGNEDRYLLGATTLQALHLIAETTNHRLIPAPVPYL